MSNVCCRALDVFKPFNNFERHVKGLSKGLDSEYLLESIIYIMQ